MKLYPLILALATLTPLPTLPSCTYSMMVHRQENGLAKLHRALANAQDKASADAAAPAVREYGSLLRSDIDTLIANGKPSLIQLALLRNSYQNSNLSAEAKSTLHEFFRIYGQSFYGSTELRQAFIDMLLAETTSARTSSIVQPSSILQTTPTAQPANSQPAGLIKGGTLLNILRSGTATPAAQ